MSEFVDPFEEPQRHAPAQSPQQGEADAAPHGSSAPEAEGAPPQEAKEAGFDTPVPAATDQEAPNPAVADDTEDDTNPVAGELPTEEEYVAQALAATRLAMASGLKEAIDADGHGRLHRTEEYARWRYRGYLAGEVGSL